MAYVFEVVEDGVIPDWLNYAYEGGEIIELLTSLGWIALNEHGDDIGFLNSNIYRVKP